MASEATPGVAEMSIEGSHSVADEEEDKDELAAADEFVPEMATDVNRLRGDLIKEADSILDPLIPSQMVGLVRRRDEDVRWEPISESYKITQADNLNRRRRLSRKAQCLKIEVGKVIKIFLT